MSGGLASKQTRGSERSSVPSPATLRGKQKRPPGHDTGRPYPRLPAQTPVPSKYWCADLRHARDGDSAVPVVVAVRKVALHTVAEVRTPFLSAVLVP